MPDHLQGPAHWGSLSLHCPHHRLLCSGPSHHLVLALELVVPGSYRSPLDSVLGGELYTYVKLSSLLSSSPPFPFSSPPSSPLPSAPQKSFKSTPTTS